MLRGGRKVPPPLKVPGEVLAARRRVFAERYVVHHNAKRAAREAGYTSKRGAANQGKRLLEREDVRAMIDALEAENTQRNKLDADYVLLSLQEVAERCLQRAPVMVRRGREMVQLVDEEDRHVWQFDSAGANKSLELLGKHLKLFTDVVEKRTASLSREERAARAAALLEEARKRRDSQKP